MTTPDSPRFGDREEQQAKATRDEAEDAVPDIVGHSHSFYGFLLYNRG
jgi:hypothetical protein